MPGSGKTTVGPLVAQCLERDFVDLDEAVAAAAGRPIPAIFAAEGEAGFRRREAAALAEVAGKEVVVACGGGIVVGTGNVDLMRGRGVVAWLEAPAATLAERVGEGAGRPLLTEEAGPAVADVLASREAAYAAAAHCRVETAGRTPEEVAKEVVQRWSEFK
ncbi:MAG: shikimate kinase [Actinomycetota bacterium]